MTTPSGVAGYIEAANKHTPDDDDDDLDNWLPPLHTLHTHTHTPGGSGSSCRTAGGTGTFVSLSQTCLLVQQYLLD
jgi:hypothetical protein